VNATSSRTHVALAALIVVLAAGCGGGSHGGGPGPGPTLPATPWVSAYYAVWDHDPYGPSSVDYSALTHLLVVAAGPKPDGTLDTSFALDPAYGPTIARALTARAHAAGKQALLVVAANWLGADFPSAASDAHRPTLVASLLAAASDLGFDGFDLYWMPAGDADKAHLLALAQDLRAAAPGKMLTLPVPWTSGSYPDADPWYGSTIAGLVDQMNVGTWSMAGAWGPFFPSWFSSALDGATTAGAPTVAACLSGYAAAGVPKARLGMGIGFLGLCYSGGSVTAPGQGLGADTVAELPYSTIMASYYATSAYHYDTAVQQPYLSFTTPYASGCTYLPYEDETSIAAKGAWLRASGYGGTTVWTLNQGYLPASSSSPLLGAVKAAFLE
jgi:chitinase